MLEPREVCTPKDLLPREHTPQGGVAEEPAKAGRSRANDAAARVQKLGDGGPCARVLVNELTLGREPRERLAHLPAQAVVDGLDERRIDTLVEKESDRPEHD